MRKECTPARSFASRQSRPILALCSLLLCVWSCSDKPPNDSGGASANDRIALDVCESSSRGTQVVAAYALKKGIFARHGLDVTLTSVNSGSRAVAALMSGSVQLCQISGSAVVHAVVAGNDLTIIGALFNTYVYSLMVSADIRSAADLKGRAIAVSAVGSASETAVRVALRTLGLQPDRDVAILAIGGQAERMAAVEAGYVAGTMLSYPEIVFARQKGLHALLDLSTLDLPTLHTGTVTTRAFLESHRAAVLNFMKAMTETVWLIKSDREAALAALGKLMELDVQQDATALEETYDVLLKRKLADIPYPSLAGIEAILAEIAHENPSAARVKPEEIADLSVVRELEDSGFFRDLPGRK